MHEFTQEIRQALASASGLSPADIRLEQPRDAAHGDFAFPCFMLAKQRKNAPPKIAAELEPLLNSALDGISAHATGPYINFSVDRARLARVIVGSVLDQAAAYGSSNEGAGKTIVIDLSSPNIAKPMSVGHLRSTVIGAALQRLHDSLGYTTVGINHIGDWGSQFGKLVAALNRWGDTVDVDADGIRALLALYVRYHDEEESDPTLKEEGRAAFRELESGVEGSVRASWRRLTELSLLEFDRIYDRLGVQFDEVRGESFYESHLDKTVDRIVASGVTQESKGALVVDLEEFDKNLPPCLLRKSDGTTLYATRDFAAAFHRWELYQFERALYVVGGEQRLHFKQLKLVLQRMGIEWEPRMEHIGFGMLRLPEGKMSTRKGRVVFLDEVLDRAVAEARRIIAEKNPGLANADEVAEQVGIGAVIFNDLKRERIKDVEFVWEEVLAFEGETGPYVQYTHARLASIERKAQAAGEGSAEPDWAGLEDAAQILLRVGRFPDVVRGAAAQCEPSEVSSYLLALCREVNAWYGNHRVLGQEAGLTAARLRCITTCKTVISNGLRLLGLASPVEM